MSVSLPDYARPPVIETILGVQFEPLAQMTNAHLGAFWKSLGDEWPIANDAVELQEQFERFSDTFTRLPAVQLQLLPGAPNVRIQIRTAQKDRLVQLQNSRLHFNWLMQDGGEYPHYPKVKQGFEWALAKFEEFATTEGIGPIRPNQWEVTYANHIPRATVWNTPADWKFFLPLGDPVGNGEYLPALVQPETLNAEWHYEIVPQRGRLHVQWQHGRIGKAREKELIILTLTARGPIAPGGESGEQTRGMELTDGLDLGREVIDRAFHGLMTRDANSFWGLKHAASDT